MPHSESIHSDADDTAKETVRNDCASPSSYLGLSYAAVSPRSAPKSVSIAPYAETISPLILGRQQSVEDLQLLNGRSPKRPSVKSPKARRLSGRLSNVSSPALRGLIPASPGLDGTVQSSNLDEKDLTDLQEESSHFDHLVDQVSAWIKEKRAKRHRRKDGSNVPQDRSHQQDSSQQPADLEAGGAKERRGSAASDESFDLDKLEKIIKQNFSLRRTSSTRTLGALRSRSSVRKLLRKQSYASDSEALENEFHVSSCDAVLDNSKTLAYTGGVSDISDDSGNEDLTRVPSFRDVDAWAKFKFEIVRLAHTLRLKGWRKVSLETSATIEVSRLSGALTNCVYVVSPPDNLPLQKEDKDGNLLPAGRAPPKLLLRIYGPQVEHLIDREAELAILRRLARKRIGPRLLGTFGNGRFEEYLHAKPLSPEDLRDPDTSRQIAKRMRELHEGIELLDQERSDGAFVWRNWDKWLQRVEQIVTWMDEQVATLEPGVKPTGPRAWLRRGHICGVPWKQFKDVIDKYRVWLRSQYGGSDQLRQQLVFAHNDTQYGNILRLVPTGDSPLLLPANTHKQLIVIDFEYASANTPGLEFANHFTEWCYNYHDKRKPYAFNANYYPKPEEQESFLRAYVRHRPQFNIDTPKMAPTTPKMNPVNSPGELAKRPTTSISDFMLDARHPKVPASPAPNQEAAALAAEDAEVERLSKETRMWRMANTIQWVAWGIVQAKVPGMPVFDDDMPELQVQDDHDPEGLLLGERAEEYRMLTQSQQQQQQLKDVTEQEEEEEFDYLGYAQHRAFFLWGDAVQMGFVKLEDLPEEIRAKVKKIPY